MAGSARAAAAATVVVDGVELRRSSRVRLRPRAGGDVLDLALAGRDGGGRERSRRTSTGNVQLAVTVVGRPGARPRRPQAARAPLLLRARARSSRSATSATRVLVAGIGNVFLGDDGFGVALADRLARRELPAGVEVVDYGIRGMDLAYALVDGWDAVVLLDARRAAARPARCTSSSPSSTTARSRSTPTGWTPSRCSRSPARSGGALPRTLVVGCEPLTRMSGDEDDVVAELTEPVRAALDEAVLLVEELLEEVIDDPRGGPS